MSEEQILSLPPAPQWAIWAGTFGKFAIFGATALLVACILLWAFAGVRPKLSKPATALFITGCAGLLSAFAVLAVLFVTNQFEFKYVFSNGDADLPLSYKIACVWTHQEGSFLLWGCTSALFGALTIWGTGIYRRWYGIAYATFLAAIGGILAYESPFNIEPLLQTHGVTHLPDLGAGMTPALQNYWVIIHPPTIFTGFGSLTVLFAYGVAAMMSGNTREWVAKARPWTLVSMAILGLGVCMGGMWAYETQGWGGFWAWDPVENVSFVPWLFSAALAHGLIVQNNKGRWTASNLLMAGLPFLAFIYGTFLTRSGLLDKVSNHSFASMDKSALVILRAFMIAVTAAYLVMFATRGRALGAKVKQPDEDGGLAREGFYRFGVITISLFATVIALGMSWPVITALRGGEGSAILEPTYHMVVVWFFVPVIIAMAIAPYVSWRSMSPRELWVRTSSVFSLSAGLTGFAMLVLTNPSFGVHLQGGENVRMPFGKHMPLVPWMAFLLFCCAFAAIGNIWRAIETSKRSSSSLGGFVAHLGFATLMAGLILSRGFEQKASDWVQEDAPANLLGYTIAYKGMSGKGVTDRDGKVLFDITNPDGTHFEARPGFYMYYSGTEEPGVQTWPDIHKSLSHDVYLSLHPPVVQVWEKPETFTPGATRAIDKFLVTYIGPTSEGPIGQPGATFGAKMRVVTPEGTFDVHPTETITDQGLKPRMVDVGPGFQMFMSRMDAADRSVSVQLLFKHPLFPVDLFYKPLTSLVWFGTALLTLGGGMSAYTRRSRKKAKAAEPAPEPARPSTGFSTDVSPKGAV